MSEQRDGFELNGRFYPWMKSMRVVDPVLVVEVTGMKYTEFVEAWGEELEKMEDLEEDDTVEIDPIVMNGLLAVSFWQQHPGWSRQKVVRFFERLDGDDLELVGEKDDADPPSPSESDEEQPENSSPSPTTSNGTQGSLSEPANQVSTGTPTSGTGSPA